MCLRLALLFHVSATSAVIKIGDTVSDIEEARNAGMWAVGVAATGNEIGLDAAALAALTDADRQHRLAIARDRLASARAHYVIDSAADVESVIDAIGHRLAAGERP
jgi:phosphonoacetaldehyde hydrolase